MSEMNELKYFLNSMKDTLPFDSEKDFRKKIHESREFRIRIQKLVYLSKFFGWENNYHFNFHKRGPYSIELKEDYNNIYLSKNNLEHEFSFKITSLKKFIENQNNEFLEATSTILYYITHIQSVDLSENTILDLLNYLKPHIPERIVKIAYEKIKEHDLLDAHFNKNNYKNPNKKIVIDKIKGLQEIFDQFKVCSNQTLILGSLEYFKLALKKEDLEHDDKIKLINVIYSYGSEIEDYYFKNYAEVIGNFAYCNLTNINEKFDNLQDYVCDLKILPRIYDEDVDLCLFNE